MNESDPQPDEERFERLALELFAFQFEYCSPYARFCTQRARTPRSVGSWREIPAVPTGAFKEVRLCCFPPERAVKTFRTSGTSVQRRGELQLDRLDLYETSLLWSFRRYVLPDLAALGGRILLRVLAPSPLERPDSSLSHMFGCLLQELGADGSGFDVSAASLRSSDLLGTLERVSDASTPIVLCGTTFAFVHLLDELERRALRISLPSGTRVMETGGFKGRSRSVSARELYAALEDRLGVPAVRVVNQYGMTELGSQFYDGVLLEPEAPRRKVGPPWARVRIVDPESDEEAGEAATGCIRILDLANTGSVAALQTADLGRHVAGGFEVLGRATGVEERGCSIAADEMLAVSP
jgi:hypothetical protein